MTACYKRLVNASVRFTMVAERGLNKLSASEIQFQSKLKLPRIERRCGPAEITTVAGPLTEGVDVVEEWRSGGLVEAIE